MSSGTYTQLERFSSNREQIEQLRDKLIQVDPVTHYKYMESIGLVYGPSFQVIQQIWKGNKEALLSITLEQSMDLKNAYHLHPILLDACFQGVACAIKDEHPKAMFLPAAIGTLKLYKKRALKSVWCHIKVQEITQEQITCDIEIVDKFGERIALVSNFVLQKLEGVIPRSEHFKDFYTLTWEEAEEVQGERLTTSHNPCLIFADDYQLGEKLAQYINSQTILVYPGQEFEKQANNKYIINPSKKEELAQLFKEINQDLNGQMLSNIVYCWGMNISEASEFSFEQFIDAYTNLVYLVQELSSIDFTEVPKLWIISNDVHHAPEEEGFSTLQAPFWGLGRTLTISHPDLWGGLIDIGVEDHSKVCERIVNDLFSDHSEKQIAYHDGKKYVARFRELGEPSQDVSTIEIRPEYSYLITGGLGFLGLTFAQWLVERGAKKIILLGRSKLPNRAEWDSVTDIKLKKRIQAVMNLEELGAEIHVFSIDVSSKVEMDGFFADYQQHGIPEIKGIIHAAGTVFNQSMEEITQDDMLKIMKPKIMGSIHLHRNFKKKDLDFFSLFSSITSLVSPPRLSVYAAANSFLDAMAHERQRLGLPAISINWGPWGEAGMAVQENGIESSQTAGMKNMSVQDGLAYFEEALKLNIAQVAIAQVNWEEIYSMFPSMTKTSFLSNLVPGELGQREVNIVELERTQDMLSKVADEEKRLILIKSFVKEQICTILKISESFVQDDTPLNGLGLDSMMAVELSTRIEVLTKVNIPMAILLRGVSIDEISSYIEMELSNSVNAAGEEEQQESHHVQEQEDNVSSSDKVEFPLSHGQRSLWFLQELSPENTAYNVGFAVRVLSGLNEETLKETLTRLVARHEALRIRVKNVNGDPYQMIESSMDYQFTSKSIKGYSEEAIRELVNNDLHQPFNLSKDPVLRAFVYETEQDHILMFVIHHIAIDYWGIELFLKDFKEIYERLSTNQVIDLPEKRNSYFDFVTWQLDFVAQSQGQNQLEYWSKQLSASEELDLPIDYSVPKVQRFEGDSVPFELDHETVQKIKGLVKSEETTLFVFLLTAYQLLLHRYSGQDELIVGSPTSGRSKASFYSVVGDFINMLPLKSNIADDPTFMELLRANKQTVLTALEHQDYPFPLLVEKLKPSRNLARSPIFQTSFILQSMNQLPELKELVYNSEEKVIDFAGLAVQSYPISQQEGQLDLTLELTEMNQKLVGALKYNTHLFKKETIERMLLSFSTLIEHIVCKPETKVKEISLLREQEKNKRFLEWNNQKEFEEFPNLFDWIEQVAKRESNRIAFEYEGQEISYGSLIKQANKVAYHLYKLNVKKGERIGIYMHRSIEMVIALLGTMKAGAIYVPMDPSFPQERLNWMVEDGDIRFVLTEAALQENKWSQEVSNMLVDEMIEQTDPVHDHEIQVQVTPEDSVYIIYTSGSTGKPKGVEIQHKALINFLQSMALLPGIEKDDKILAITTLSFDISILEIFLPLTVGAKAIILSREDTMDGKKMQSKIEQLKPTIIQATPATWRMLIDSGWSGQSGLKALCGGEALTTELAKQLRSKCDSLWNLYGPTEATVWMTITEIDQNPEKITVGKPIHNMEAHILDDYLNPLPIGVTGHLYIAGIGLAKGYLNRPDLNQEKFNTITLANGEVKRVYSTGDTARLLANGDIEYLGRSDSQVKINGYRIELGEIESLLNIHPSINEAIVLADKGAGRDKLVAYIKTKEYSTELKVEELRSYLKNHLPEYMIPTGFVKTEEIPLTPNGKVDRLKLQQMEGERIELATTFVAPETHIEEELSKLWQELLQKEKVGINDNFFDLGGSSLLAAKLQMKVKENLDIQVTILDIFQYPTISSLSKFLTEIPEQKDQERIEKLEKGKRRLDLIREQRRGARQKKGDRYGSV